MSRALKDCPNCLQRFASHYPHCPYCGQKAGDQLTLNVVFNNTISNYFSVDARFFKSFIPLMFKPGQLPKHFISGRRLKYLHPAQMYLFISIVFFFLFSFVSREKVEGFDNILKKELEHSQSYRDSIIKASHDIAETPYSLESDVDDEKHFDITHQQQKQFLDSVLQAEKNRAHVNLNIGSNKKEIDFNEMEIDSMIAAGASDEELYKKLGMKTDDGYLTKRMYMQILKFLKTKSGGSILQEFLDSIPIATFILLPIFALLLKLFYYREGRFVHHLVFTFYFFAFLFSVFSLLVIVNLIWKDFPGWIMNLTLLSVFFYLFFGVKRLYGQGYIRSFIKSSAISLLFLAMVLPFTVLTMGLMAFLFY